MTRTIVAKHAVFLFKSPQAITPMNALKYYTIVIFYSFISACTTDNTEKQTELVKKENELLKKENELLKKEMAQKDTLIEDFSNNTTKIADVPYGNFKITKSIDCNIDFGRIQTAKPENGKFRFRIDINNKTGYEGAVDGYAYFISDTVAIFKDNECKSLRFTFQPNKIINIKETNCESYHGANICFNV